MMIFSVLFTLQVDSLKPGQSQNLPCDQEKQTIKFTYKSKLNQIQLVIESNEIADLKALVTDSKNKQVNVPLGLLTDLSELDAGELTLQYSCSATGSILAYYYDSQVAYEAQQYVANKEENISYFMFPVCYQGKPIQIQTNGTVTYDFTNGYPEPYSNSSNVIDNKSDLIHLNDNYYSSYLFMKLEGSNVSLTVYQNNLTEIDTTDGKEITVNISSLYHCFRQFFIPQNTTVNQIIVSGKGNKNYNTHGRIYYKQNLNLSELPTDVVNDKSSTSGVLDISNNNNNGAFSVRPYQRLQYMPLEHNLQQFSGNELVLLVLKDTQVLPLGINSGASITISNDLSQTFLVDYKSVSDFSYSDSSQEQSEIKYRYFAARVTSEQNIQNISLQFCVSGLHNCSLGDGMEVQTSENSVQIIYKALDNETSPYIDLLGLSVKSTSAGQVPDGNATVEAVNMYLLKPFTIYKYKGKNQKFGVVNLLSDNLLQLQILKLMAESVKISISQKFFFPSQDLNDSTFQTQTCSQKDLLQGMCILNFVNLERGNVYLSFESTNSFEVIAGEGANIATLLHINQEAKGKLTIFNDTNSIIKLPYMLPMDEISDIEKTGSTSVLFISELNSDAVKEIMKDDIDIKVYIGYDQNPEKSQNTYYISMRDWVSDSVLNNNTTTVSSRGHLKIPTKGSGSIYATVTCTGQCLNGNMTTAINFNLYATVLYDVAEYSEIQDQAFDFVSGDEPISGTFNTLDLQSALIKFYRPTFNSPFSRNQIFRRKSFKNQKLGILEKIKENVMYDKLMRDLGVDYHNQLRYDQIDSASGINCTSLKYTVTMCIGIYPREDDYDQLPSSCLIRHIDMSLNSSFMSLTLDSSQYNVSSGDVYFRIDPDESSFVNDPALIEFCQVKIDLYLSDQLLDFNKNYTQILYAGSNQQVHLALDFPAYAEKKANGTELGDYFIFKLQSEKNVTFCITDDINRPYGSSCVSKGTSSSFQQAQYFKNYRNENPVGQLKPHTRVYITLSDACDKCTHMEPYQVNVLVLPQTSVKGNETQYFSFQSTEYYGSPEYISFAVDMSGIDYQKNDATLIVTPDCFTQDCKSNPPQELQLPNLITYVSFSQELPDARSGKTVILDNSGPHTVSLQQVSNGTGMQGKQKVLYVHIQYRYAEYLELTGGSSPLTFSLRIQQGFGVENQLNYQETKRVQQLGSAQPVVQYSATLYYEPSEIVIFPCKGRVGLAMSRFSLPNPAQNGTYENIMAGEWGKPLIWRVYDIEQSAKTIYLGIYDANAYNSTTNSFVNVSTIEYDLFVGSSATLNVPGGNGAVEVVDFSSSGDGKVKVRFAPASTPNQNTTVSKVNYYLYAIPYAGSLNQTTDYSPYTACGVKTTGYSIYTNSINLSTIEVDEAQVEKYGYIEVESNLPLWRDSKNVSKALTPLQMKFQTWKQTIGGLKAVEKRVLYVTVLAGQISYTGTLVENSPISQATLLTITLIVTLLVVAILVIIFWVFFVRVRKIKKQGYKPVIA